MIKKEDKQKQSSLFFDLSFMLNSKHPLFILSNEINWEQFEDSFTPLYCSDNGRMAKPIRLMVGLQILKHLRNLSDESVVEHWSENAYYQYFCGENMFMSAPPCEASELVHFRNRIGEAGIELILKESIRINGTDAQDSNVSIDTTVQEKNITFPTDAKLHRKIIAKCKKFSVSEGLELRQTYTRTLKKLGLAQRFRNHPKNKSKARKADKKVKTIAGRLVRELERKLPADSSYHDDLLIFKRILNQKKEDKHKCYSIHEPDVECISKGKEHKKYEFGNKVSIVHTQTTGVIVGALSFRNPYDGNTLEDALCQAKRLIGQSTIKKAIADRGYRGKAKVNDVEILVPKAFTKPQTTYQQQQTKKYFRRRAAIEPVIGHLKSDYRLSRNFYKGIVGDNINIMLAAAAFNFKRMVRKWKLFLCNFLMTTFSHFFQKFYTVFYILQN